MKQIASSNGILSKWCWMVTSQVDPDLVAGYFFSGKEIHMVYPNNLISLDWLLLVHQVTGTLLCKIIKLWNFFYNCSSCKFSFINMNFNNLVLFIIIYLMHVDIEIIIYCGLFNIYYTCIFRHAYFEILMHVMLMFISPPQTSDHCLILNI